MTPDEIDELLRESLGELPPRVGPGAPNPGYASARAGTLAGDRELDAPAPPLAPVNDDELLAALAPGGPSPMPRGMVPMSSHVEPDSEPDADADDLAAPPYNPARDVTTPRPDYALPLSGDVDALLRPTEVAVPPMDRDPAAAMAFESSRQPLTAPQMAQFSRGWQQTATPDPLRSLLPDKTPPPDWDSSLQDRSGLFRDFRTPPSQYGNGERVQPSSALLAMGQQRIGTPVLSPLDAARLAEVNARTAEVNARAARAGQPEAPADEGETPLERARREKLEAETARLNRRGTGKPTGPATPRPMTQAQIEANADRDRANTERQTQLSAKNAREYKKDIGAWSDVSGMIADFERDNPKGDIEGVGPIDRMTPDIMSSEKALKNRRTLDDLNEAYARARSGAAISLTEDQRFRVQTGTARGASAQQVRVALGVLKEWSRKNMDAFAVGRDKEAQEVQRRSGLDPNEIHPTAAPSFRIRDPKTGRTGTFTGSLAEARQAGLELLR